MIHASCILTLAVERGATNLKQAFKVVEAIRKNKLRSVTELETDEIINQVLEEFAQMQPFIKTYTAGDIPE